MFRSIRWRLVASYVFITLLAVSLVGLLTLSLVRRYVRQQEADYLRANAQTIARQALPLMQPLLQPIDLAELTQTASFFTNARVRILDPQRRVLADSGSGIDQGQFLWFTPGERLLVELDTPVSPSGSVLVTLPSGRPLMIPSRPGESFPILDAWPADIEVRIVRRIQGPWGDRLLLHTIPHSELSAIPFIDEEGIQERRPDPDTPRSEQIIVAPIGPEQQPLGYVELSSSPDFSVQTLATTGRSLLFAAGGTTLLAVLVGLLVSRGLTAPLRSLSAAASRMSQNDWSARAPVRGKDEIGQLAGQFNHMADRLEASFAELAAERDALRRFIADASHELRTPITALRTFNELLQDEAADEPLARSEFLAESHAQINRLEWITHNLLDLSRLEAGLIQLALADHRVDAMIRTAASTFRGLAAEKGVRLSIGYRLPELVISCDRARIESALCNLLDNAIKFTPSGKQVEIGAELAGEMIQIWVRDDGPGIRPEDLPHIFKRFYRGQDVDAEGSGLGLAIVQSIVVAHGGRVWAESEPSQGSRFVMELQRA